MQNQSKRTRGGGGEFSGRERPYIPSPLLFGRGGVGPIYRAHDLSGVSDIPLNPT